MVDCELKPSYLSTYSFSELLTKSSKHTKGWEECNLLWWIITYDFRGEKPLFEATKQHLNNNWIVKNVGHWTFHVFGSCFRMLAVTLVSDFYFKFTKRLTLHWTPFLHLGPFFFSFSLSLSLSLKALQNMVQTNQWPYNPWLTASTHTSLNTTD